MYRNLSEIKSEIESVIKTGRKLCEDKTTTNPKKLGQRIDNLKHLYNTLGDNVTRSKKDLETLLKYVEKLTGNFDVIELGLRFHERQSTHNNDNDEPTPSLEKIEEHLDECYKIYSEYRKICKPLYLEDLKKTIDEYQDRFAKLSNTDIIKNLVEMKSTLQNMDNISIETLR
jgi:regulator of replication initiation timing